jgi:hypothetical protein
MRNMGNITLFASTILLVSGCQSNSVDGYFSPIPSSNSTSSTTSSSGGTIGPSNSTTGPGVTVSPGPGPTMKPTPTVTPTPSPSPSGAVVCSQLGNTGTGSTNQSAGLVATLSYFPFAIDPSTGWEINTIGNVDLADFATMGTVLTNNVFFNQVDIPSEHFTAGFPTADGTLLKSKTGAVLTEYFSLDFQSQIVLGPNDAPGNYEFLTLSDDGSIFSVDTGSGMTPLISADGEHSSTVACASKTVAMTKTTQLKMDLKYFQGPHDTIAMIVMWRPITAGESLSDTECGHDGGDGYYFNEDTLAPLSPYEGLLARGWKVLGSDNFLLPASTGTNPCLTGSGQ